MENLNIGFIGFGLIGGSIARALKAAHPDYTITVTSRSSAPVYHAQNEGIVDVVAETINSSFAACDYIFLCTPVVTITKYLGQLKEIKKDTCIITDVGSVKGIIHKTISELNMEDCFIGGHPMTGSEQSGYTNSSSALMINAKYVVTPTAKTTKEQLAAYVRLVKDMKSVPIVMDYTCHDNTVAGISHLPHIAAAGLSKLIKENEDDQHFMHLLAAGGFKDTTRIAASSPEMWEQICMTNSEAISDFLSKYIDLLTEIRSQINSLNGDYVSELFKTAGEYRNTFTEH